MKRCSRCGEIKPYSDFHRDNRKGDGYQRYCKNCRRAYDHEYYSGAHLGHKAGRKESKARRFGWMRELKTNRPCTDCGLIFPPEAMQWDHLPGFVKLGEISGTFLFVDRRLLVEELAKCELVCANCQAIRTRARLIAKLQSSGRGAAR